MTPIHKRDVDGYWATEMAVTPEFRPVKHGVYCTVQRLYSGVQLFLRDECLVIASPPSHADVIASRVSGLPISEVFSVEYVKRLLSPEVGKILGTARVGYADASSFRPSFADSCRILTHDDTANLRALAAALSDAELEQSGFDADEAPAFGAFFEGVLCAVASYQIWEPRIAHITVATFPNQRRRGHGRAVISALARHAFTKGLVLQYRALASNVDSLALGDSLGFQGYCSTIYARLPGA